jgi:hypothetical protein
MEIISEFFKLIPNRKTDEILVKDENGLVDLNEDMLKRDIVDLRNGKFYCTIFNSYDTPQIRLGYYEMYPKPTGFYGHATLNYNLLFLLPKLAHERLIDFLVHIIEICDKLKIHMTEKLGDNHLDYTDENNTIQYGTSEGDYFRCDNHTRSKTCLINKICTYYDLEGNVNFENYSDDQYDFIVDNFKYMFEFIGNHSKRYSTTKSARKILN